MKFLLNISMYRLCFRRHVFFILPLFFLCIFHVLSESSAQEGAISRGLVENLELTLSQAQFGNEFPMTLKSLEVLVGIFSIFIFLVILHDYRLRKNILLTTKKLTESQSKYREIFEGSRDGFVMISTEGKIIDANYAYCEILGYSLDELKKMDNNDSNSPIKWRSYLYGKKSDKEFLKDERVDVIEKEYTHKNGEIFTIEIKIHPVCDTDGKSLYFWAITRDITGEKKTRHILENKMACEYVISRILSLSIENYTVSKLMEKSIEIVGAKIEVARIRVFKNSREDKTFINTHEWVANGVSAQKDKLMKFSWDEMRIFIDNFKRDEVLKYDNIEEISDKNMRTIMSSQNIKAILIAPIFVHEELYGFICFEECRMEYKWSECQKATILSVSKIFSSVVEHELSRNKELLLLTAIEHNSEAVVVTDMSGKIEYANPAFEKISGYSCVEALGQNPKILKSGKQGTVFYQTLWGDISSGKVWSGRFVNKRKDGTLYIENAVISPVFDVDGKIIKYIAIKSDITTQLKLEEQYSGVQKMDSIGRLAGGMAHDFNNMLAVILGFVDIALSKVKKTDSIYSDLEQINKAAKRSSALTKQLLVFARRDIACAKLIIVNDEINGVLEMLRRTVGEDIEFKLSLSKEVLRVKMDPSQLDQIIMNLCINAKDAIEGRGVIKFRTEKFSFDQQFCDENPEYIPGEFVLLAVEDNGAGMTDTIMSNIFEPFFTTKSAGKGTGLGLSTVYGVVKQNKGFITVSSTHGSGSIFNVYIPFASEEPGEDATMSKKIVSPNARMSGAKDKVILLVEDEPAIMHVCDSILTNLGYTVIKKENPLDAIAFAREYKGKIDLLFTDVIMPEMNGRELADEILTLYPQCVVLFMSGYTADTMLEKGISQLNAGLIRKPFSRNELELRVTEILG